MKRSGGWGRVTGLLLLAVVSAPQALGQDTDAHPKDTAARPSYGEFVFTRAMSGTYLKTPEGERQVSFAHGDYICPRLLPRQSKLLINSLRGGRPGIWVEDIEGDTHQRICDGDQVSVSSDGQLIVLRRNGVIVSLPLPSSAPTLPAGVAEIVSPAGWRACSFPSFHPDGRVLFVSVRDGRDRVYLTDPRRPSSPQFLFDGELRSTPRCSPDGNTIAYQNGARIYLYELDTTSHRRATFAGGVQSWPMWSQDGESLAYLQSPTPFDGPRHIYNMRLDSPHEVSLVVRDVELGPDWNGIGFSRGIPSALRGNRIDFWQSDAATRAPGDLAHLLNPEQGWSPLPAGQRAKGDVIVACEWGVLYLSAATGKLFLIPRDGSSASPPTEMRLVDGRGRQARSIASVDVAAPTVDEASIASVFRVDGAGSIEAGFSVSRTRPSMEIKPTPNLGGLFVAKSLDLAVVPDRLGNDLIYHPADHSSSSTLLPRAPFVLGMADDKSGLLMVAAPSSRQLLRLVRDQERGTFPGVDVQCADESVLVSMVPGDGLWRTTEVTSAGGGAWQATWSNPFAGQWRLATQGEGQNFAMMSTLDSPTREKSLPLEEMPRFARTPTRSVIYLYGRSQNTPLDTTTPMDVLYDALGLDHTTALLDIEGIRSHRHADEWVPYKDPRAALEILSWIWRRDRPGTQQKVDDVCDDILASLRGLDMRLDEYEAFATQVDRTSRRAGASGPARLLFEIVDRRLAELEQQLRGTATTHVSAVAASAQGFRSNRGGGLSELRRVVTAALSERQRALAAHREFARSVRDTAGLAVAHIPEARDTCEGLRDLSGHVLRNRAHLEGDWRGEQPFGGPEVPYDKITDL